MRAKTFLILLLMFSVVVAAALLVRSNLRTGETVAAIVPPQPRMILVAARPLDVGTLVRPEDVRWHVWPEESILATHLERPDTVSDGDTSTSEAIGAVIRRPMVEGEPLLVDSIVKPGDRGFLAAVLNPGMRAISVAVNAVSGAAGLIFPGDRVDLILSQSFDRGDFPLSQRSVSETIVQNLRVLATDQQLQQGKPESVGTDGRIARTVTLEVTREQAEKITVAAELGQISLTLRSLADEGETSEVAAEPAPVAPTWAADVSPALKMNAAVPTAAPRTAAVRPTVQVMRGSQSEQVQPN